jgi:hypothetical protein
MSRGGRARRLTAATSSEISTKAMSKAKATPGSRLPVRSSATRISGPNSPATPAAST